MKRKNKTTTALLALFLGFLGIHRFYLDEPGKGILYVLLSFTLIPFIVAFVDFIIFFTMSQKDFDWKYNPHLFHRTRANERFYREYGNRNYSKNRYSDQNSPYEQSHNANYSHNQNRKHTKPSNKNKKIKTREMIKRVNEVRDEILHKVKRSDHFENGIISEIRPMVDKYTKQVKELITREEKLEHIIAKNPLYSFDNLISDLKQKASETNNPKLKYEYQNAVAKLEKQKETIIEFKEQKEMIELRLDSTIMSLEQIKFDLIRIESLAVDEQRKEFTRMFEEKSQELNTYIDLLKEGYES